MIQPVPRSTPADQNVDARGISAFLDGLESMTNVEPHSIMLLRAGNVIAEGCWAPYTQDRVHLLYSLSKTFTSTAVGFAIDEDLLSLDDRVLTHFPELDSEVTDPRARSMRVKDILAMASGHEEDTWERALQADPSDPVRGFLLTPVDHNPGTTFAYNQSCTYTAAAIIQKISGQSIVEFLRPRLFNPLGIGEVGWLSDSSGRQLGFSGMFAQTDAIARLGQFYLQRGQWQGRQLLSASWIDLATSLQVSTEKEENPDWKQGYGYQFWMARHGYRGDGAYGQFCVVLPEYDVVLALTGQCIDMQKVLSLAWEYLLPAFNQEVDVSGAAETDALLAERLSHAALPPIPGAEHLPPLIAQTFEAVPGNAHPRLTSIRLERVGDDHQWTLTLIDGDDPITVAPGIGAWNISNAIAASAGATANGAVAVDVLFLETPHRLHLLLDLESSTFTAEWASVPLHPLPLNELCKPVEK